MAYATTIPVSREIRLPHVTLPKPRWPHVSSRTRALLMIGLMISPAFLADQIGWCVERLFMTADQIAAQQVPDDQMMSRVNVFHVACASTDMPATEQRRWSEFAARNDWPRYPEAGPTCFQPDRNMYGIAGLTAFNVACPTAILTVADQRRWVGFAANHGWTDYSQAGTGCVDP